LTETIYSILYDSLIYAIETNDLDYVRLMLENRKERKSWLDTLRYNLYKNINIHDGEEHALQTACSYNRYDIVKYLIEIGEKLNSKINIHVGYDYAIIHFCYDGNIEMVKYLIEYCYRINDNFTNEFYSKTILIGSCTSCNLELVKYIIEYCEKINDKIQLKYFIDSLYNCNKQPCTNDILDYLFYLMKHNYYTINSRKYLRYKYLNRYIATKYIKYKCADISSGYILNNMIYMFSDTIHHDKYIDNYVLICG